MRQLNSLYICHRVTKWIPTTAGKMGKFLGLMMWMELLRLSNLSDYWSSKNYLSTNNNSFQRDQIDNRIRKIQQLVDMLEKKYKELFFLDEEIVIDETLVT